MCLGLGITCWLDIMRTDNYDHWLWGENTLREDNPEYLINLEIGVSIRFNSSIAIMNTMNKKDSTLVFNLILIYENNN